MMRLGSSITAIGFWSGILLPVVYVPVFLTGIDSIDGLSLVGALLTINVLALVVGHDYPGARSR